MCDQRQHHYNNREAPLIHLPHGCMHVMCESCSLVPRPSCADFSACNIEKHRKACVRGYESCACLTACDVCVVCVISSYALQYSFVTLSIKYALSEESVSMYPIHRGGWQCVCYSTRQCV